MLQFLCRPHTRRQLCLWAFLTLLNVQTCQQVFAQEQTQAQSPNQNNVEAYSQKSFEASAQFDPVVVTATRIEQSLSHSIPAAQVITHQQIVDSQAVDLPTLLRTVPGVQISQSGGVGSQTNVFMRGASANQVLILLDGVRIESGTVGTSQLAQIMLEQIDHIEIVRGNVSALYGSQAIGGVIQIFTKQGAAHAPSLIGEVGYGRYNSQHAQVAYGGTVGDSGQTRFNITGSINKTDSFSPLDAASAPSANPNNHGNNNKSIVANIAHQFNELWEGGFNIYESIDHLNYGNAYGQPTDINQTHERVGMISAFIKGNVTTQWSTRFTMAQGQDQAQNFLNGQSSSVFNTHNNQLDWQNDFELKPGQRLLAGYTYLNQMIDASVTYPTTSRQVNSVYAGYVGDWDRNHIQFNIRRDDYSDFGSANTFYTGYGFDLTSQIKWLASISTAFRAPSFNELYYPGYGNANLQPERANSIETGLQYASSMGLWRVNAFQTLYRDLINSSSIAPYLASNIDHAEVQGIEATYQGQWQGFDIGASGTLQNPRDTEQGSLLPRRAQHFASLTVGKVIGATRLGAEWFVSGSSKDSVFNDVVLGGYSVMNLTARYDLTKKIYVSARLENIFNKQYQVAYPYNTPGRGLYVNLGWH